MRRLACMPWRQVGRLQWDTIEEYGLNIPRPEQLRHFSQPFALLCLCLSYPASMGWAASAVGPVAGKRNKVRNRSKRENKD
jgi:hypothetical protein